MSEDKVQELMRKHPAWFMFDFHPIRFTKKLSGTEQNDEKEIEVDKAES